MFTTTKDAIDWIEHIKRKERRTSLDRMKYCLKMLGNPQNYYKKVHIAGTNGKGATTYICSKILQQRGYKVGMFTSPYIVCFNERIMVNDDYISDNDLLELTNQVKIVTDKYNFDFQDVVPFFEVVTLIGFLYFKLQKVDYACVEVGLGGLMDATNVIDANCCIITSIGFDHMNVLGNSLEEIAYQKLGIVKEHNHLITGVDPSLYSFFEENIKNKNATIEKIFYSDLKIKSTLESTSFWYQQTEYNIPLIGSFQALNAVLAIKACLFLDSSITNSMINQALKNLKWPGRLEVVQKNPTMILDGGHNIHAINQVVSSLKEILCTQKVWIIYAALKDKETDKVTKKLCDIANHFVITTLPDSRAKDPYEIINEFDFESKEVIPDFSEAIEKVQKMCSKDDVILIIGSLHFISLVRNQIK